MTNKRQPADEALDNISTCDSDGNRYPLCGHAKRTLVAWADTRAREAEQRVLDSLIFAADIDGKLTVADLQAISSNLRTPEQEGTAS